MGHPISHSYIPESGRAQEGSFQIRHRRKLPIQAMTTIRAEIATRPAITNSPSLLGFMCLAKNCLDLA